jgi:hypothetical protein
MNHTTHTTPYCIQYMNFMIYSRTYTLNTDMKSVTYTQNAHKHKILTQLLNSVETYTLMGLVSMKENDVEKQSITTYNSIFCILQVETR